MRIISIAYFFKTAFQSLFKNSLMTFASIFTVSSCIFIMMTSYNIAANINYMLAGIENSIGLTTYINDSTTSARANNLYSTIVNIPHVSSVKYVSSQDAFNNLKENFGTHKKILDGLPADTLLPRSFEIYLDDNRYASSVVAKLNQYVGDNKDFSSIRHDQEDTDIIININNIIKIISISLIVGLCFISTIIINNTIKIAVNNRKTEINIMKYIGATDWFIRWPFFIEGFIIGLVGATIPILITMSTYTKVVVYLDTHLGFASSIFRHRPVNELLSVSVPIALALGISLGVISSIASIHKHLQV